jgi:hypothetical protein
VLEAQRNAELREGELKTLLYEIQKNASSFSTCSRVGQVEIAVVARLARAARAIISAVPAAARSFPTQRTLSVGDVQLKAIAEDLKFSH